MKVVVYRIRDWGAHFENNRTRELKYLDWVPMPNKMDGDGYTALVDHLDGDAHFGVWCTIVEIASRCDPRGTLLRDGAKPHTPASLARLSRLPESSFEAAIPRLLDIGWLETVELEVSGVTELSHDDAINSHPSAEKRLRNGTERNGTELREVSLKPSCSEPSRASEQFARVEVAEVAYPHFPITARGSQPNTWQLSDALISELATTYPAVDIPRECRMAWQWVKANLNRRKTSRGMPKFLNGWMARQQDRGGSGNGSAIAAHPRSPTGGAIEQKRRLEAIRET